MTKDEILLAQREFLFPSVFHYYKKPLVISHAKDQYVYDADGNQYLDFFGGIVTISVGHCNEQVNRKVHAQMDKLQHVSTVFATEPLAAHDTRAFPRMREFHARPTEEIREHHIGVAHLQVKIR